MISLGTERYAAILTIGGLIEKLFSQRCGARNRNRNNEWRLIECLCQRYKCQEECDFQEKDRAGATHSALLARDFQAMDQDMSRTAAQKRSRQDTLKTGRTGSK